MQCLCKLAERTCVRRGALARGCCVRIQRYSFQCPPPEPFWLPDTTLARELLRVCVCVCVCACVCVRVCACVCVCVS